MYGLVLQSISENIRQTLGIRKWEEIRKRAGLKRSDFDVNAVYSETVVARICDATNVITGMERGDLMESFGHSFVSFVTQYGYDNILKVLGRNLRDFLNGMDNLHEYLKFSYPKLKAPSFFCEGEYNGGLTLHYRSRRKGYVRYVQGQIKHIAKLIYKQQVDISVVSEAVTNDTVQVVLKLQFDNHAFAGPGGGGGGAGGSDAATRDAMLPMNPTVFFEMFPFYIAFDRRLTVISAGSGLIALLGRGLVGQRVDEVFFIVRPFMDFNWDLIVTHTNNIFELCTAYPVRALDLRNDGGGGGGGGGGGVGRWSSNLEHQCTDQSECDMDANDGDVLRIKGQMMHMRDWDCIFYMGTPVMEDVEAMMRIGLYINDLSMHDSSRDLVLAGTQQSPELKIALDREQQKSRKLEVSMKNLDREMKRSDELLYQMIPKPVADRLRSGEAAINTCEVFANVTVMFSDVVGFAEICQNITPMGVVDLLNHMYTRFDELIELHRVYKVETINDSYMVVAGAPIVTEYHASLICNMAIEMCDVITTIQHPAAGESLKIRVGVHSGTVVAGVVGVASPRYCLFGDSVNTASRMLSNGEVMKVHISQTTKEELHDAHNYEITERGTIDVKGKGTMKTYWIKPGNNDIRKATCQ